MSRPWEGKILGKMEGLRIHKEANPKRRYTVSSDYYLLLKANIACSKYNDGICAYQHERNQDEMC